MKIGMEVGLGPGHNVLDGDPAPHKRVDTALQFLAHVCCGQTAGWIKMPLGTEVGLSPFDTVLDMASECFEATTSWMRSNRLQPNPEKMEVLWCATA